MKTFLATVVAGSCIFAVLAKGQARAEISCQELARPLADSRTRASVVERIAAKPGNCIAALIQLTESTPEGIDEMELAIGLADTFGKVRYSEAVPFLIRNIDIERFSQIDKWSKNSEILKKVLPAADALIRIGQPACWRLVQAASGRVNPEIRLILLFVLSQIGSPDTKDFLRMMYGYSSSEKRWIETGLATVDRNKR